MFTPDLQKTEKLLLALCRISPERAAVVADALVYAAQERPFADATDFTCWIGQMKVESGCFRYSAELWGPTRQQAAYDTGKKARELGNTPEADGDGYANRGSGWLQITGGRNLDACADALNIPRDKIAHQLREDPRTAARGAAWWWTANRASRFTRKPDLTALSGLVNCGNPKCQAINHLPERIAACNEAMRLCHALDDRPPLTQSRTVGGVATAAGGVGTAVITAGADYVAKVAAGPGSAVFDIPVQGTSGEDVLAIAERGVSLLKSIEPLVTSIATYSPVLFAAAFGLCFIGLGVAWYARVDDRNKGKN